MYAQLDIKQLIYFRISYYILQTGTLVQLKNDQHPHMDVSKTRATGEDNWFKS